MWIGIVTLLPELFENFSSFGVTRRAYEDESSLDCHFFNPRDYTTRNHGQVDDKPYGGGPGMVMQVEPLEAALDEACQQSPMTGQTPLIVPTPQGQPLTQALVQQLAEQPALIFLCGRYEGIDERVLERHKAQDAGPVIEVSLGDFVLTGGELPTQVMLDALSRWLPGILGNSESAQLDSFANGLLEAPVYTRPERLADGREVPPVLVSGDHKRIARYRRKQSLARTLARRPEMLLQVPLDELDRALLLELFAEGGPKGPK